MQKIIITIDGYSSCGKSTLARQLAKKLNYIFIDSGAMYRAITLYFLENKVNTSDESAIENALGNIRLQFVFNETAGKSDIQLNDRNVEKEIRSMQVNNHVSDIATLEKVRHFAVNQQQQMGLKKGIVMDGRDIGTTVFPKAELKIFMTASIEVRTHRRYDELKSKMPDISLEEIRENLLKRDLIDSTRKISPLRQAEDAITLDNSKLSMPQQLSIAENWVSERLAQKVS
ncbi:MAG TPA: (d)CMP kinase [Arachidicoccus sp.]|nr:(d)CMP kinase [Arachidicoccus sp.]